MIRHFRLSSELSGAIAKKTPTCQKSAFCDWQFLQSIRYIYIYIQSTPLNRVTSVRGYFDPIKRRTLLTENIFVLTSMCESYSGPAKSGPIKRLTHLNSGPIKRSRLYIYTSALRLLALRGWRTQSIRRRRPND